ncbi:hypothetical protein [Aquisalibacillus elongatus]|uniref:Uncharacterized protein n=1 Tax=Aquisalibacillus elongatus TaxID=485577 RepID=A0A3N5C297_9BACI|nr:hypothetical protein [Aquisalibacillus elongatus]RPF52135.1 hypothetical protein EDC24_2125 [Aquisalibacillus elongatus]
MDSLRELLLSSLGPVVIVAILFFPMFYSLNKRVRELEDELIKKKSRNDN